MRSKQKVRTKKASRLRRLKKQRQKRRITILVCSLLLLGSIGFIGWKLYIKNKCKDLDYAVQHYLTSNKIDNSLLSVKTMSLTFSDDTTAVVKAYGLSKEKPHSKSGIEGMFRKDSLNSWTLESTNLIKDAN